MTQKFKKFSSIGAFSNIVKNVRDHAKYNNIEVPSKVTFSGSCKLHGTNFCVALNPQGEVWFQSRERILCYASDNAGSCTWGEQHVAEWKEIYRQICSAFNVDHDNFYVWGEWVGSKIQSGVALSQLKEKKFGIFKVAFVKSHFETVIRTIEGVVQEPVEEETFVETLVDPVPWHDTINSLMSNVFVIDAIVPPVLIDIDFNEPHLVQNKLLELTLAVEAECPVGKYFGISGIGEGLVFSTDQMGDQRYLYKVKGILHSSSKVKELRELTEAEITSKAGVADFVEYACTENRMKQGVDKLSEMGRPIIIQNLGTWIKWLGNDILSECQDTLVASGIERKDVMPKISEKAKNWFIRYLNSEMNLKEAA